MFRSFDMRIARMSLVSDSIATHNQTYSDPTLILCFISDKFRNLCFPKKQSFRLMLLNPASCCSMAPLNKPGQCLGGKVFLNESPLKYIDVKGKLYPQGLSFFLTEIS